MFVLLSSRIKEHVIRQRINLNFFKYGLSIFYSLNSLLVMMQPFISQDGRFDLRSIPVFIVSYSWGWKYGVISAILPSLYRIYLGKPGVIGGVFCDIILVAIIGAVFHNDERSVLDNINKKRVMTIYSLYLLFCLPGLLLLSPGFQTALMTVFLYPLFSITTLFIIIIIINETNQSIRHSVVEYDNLEAIFFENKKRLENSLAMVDLFGKLSHEFKTPLNLIFSSMQMLIFFQKKGEDDKFHKYISIMRQNAYRILKLVNNLLDLVKMNSDCFKLNLQNTDIVKVISDTVHSLEEFINNKNRVLIFRTNVSQKVMACDPVNVERILLNLLSNAVKFTDEGDIITVSIVDKGNQIELSVKDTGIGIKSDNFDKIFTEFIQVDETLVRNHEGSGLGLAIVKLLVEKHNGQVRVCSEENKGTEFIINLPVRKLPDMGEEPEIASDIDRIKLEFSDIY